MKVETKKIVVPQVALTICQPYASLIAHGMKRVENRTWKPFSTLGENFHLAIHAGSSKKWLGTYDGEMPPGIMPYGAIVAVSRVVAVLLPHDAVKWDKVHSSGPWCWCLDDVVKLQEPVPMSGAQGLWYLNADQTVNLSRELHLGAKP